MYYCWLNIGGTTGANPPNWVEIKIQTKLTGTNHE
jgi:hypothetical protein